MIMGSANFGILNDHQLAADDLFSTHDLEQAPRMVEAETFSAEAMLSGFPAAP